jgi:hypothetical protein
MINPKKRWLTEPHAFVPETGSYNPEARGKNRHCELCWKVERHPYHQVTELTHSSNCASKQGLACDCEAPGGRELRFVKPESGGE